MMREMDFIDECYADKDLSLLKKLTLVIPTYNRNYYLSRCLWYHAHFPFGEIIVADSSPEEKKAVNRETVQKIREMFGANIRYLEYEPETEKYGGDIYRKWGDAVQHVETEYSKICTDKEFVLPDAVNMCVEFLEGHLDYNTADGLSLLLRNLTGNTAVSKWEAWTPQNKSYEDDDPVERCRDAIRTGKNPLGHWNMLTAIRRSKFHKGIYKELMRYSLNDIRIGDFYPQLLSILCSKRKYFQNIPYLVRDLSSLQNSMGKISPDESSTVRYPKIPECVREGLFDEKIPLIKLSISGILEGFHRYTPEEITAYTNEIVSGFLCILGNTDYSKQKLLYSSKTIYTMLKTVSAIYMQTYKYIIHNLLEPIGIKISKPNESKTSTPYNPENYSRISVIEKLIKSTISSHNSDRPIAQIGQISFEL